MLKDKKTKITFHSGVLTIGGTIIEIAYVSIIDLEYDKENNKLIVNPSELIK